jgi:hypothetical protein
MFQQLNYGVTKKECIQVCINIDHNKDMLECINLTNLENTQLL